MKRNRLLALIVAFLMAISLNGCTDEELMQFDINESRKAYSIAPLGVDSAATTYAENWARKMASAGRISHSPLSFSICPTCSMLGENVGVGTDLAKLHDAFMASTAHRTNILNPKFDEVGIGVYKSADGRYWVTEVFLDN
jgi:uncharacterized protein YkwD